jgi:hypothetical protein
LDKLLINKQTNMAKKSDPIESLIPLRESRRKASTTKTKHKESRECKECRVNNAFQATMSSALPASYNMLINFNSWNIVPPGKRAVIELVTASIEVPAGERARLRMYTSLGYTPSNLDLVVTHQGQTNGREILICTQSLRVYTDNEIMFNINRDNPFTTGYALICISGYLVDL